MKSKLIKIVVGTALAGGMALMTAAPASALTTFYTCYQTPTGFDGYKAITSKASGESMNVKGGCGAVSVRVHYTVPTTGYATWSTWKTDSTDALIKPGYNTDDQSQHKASDFPNVHTFKN